MSIDVSFSMCQLVIYQKRIVFLFGNSDNNTLISFFLIFELVCFKNDTKKREKRGKRGILNRPGMQIFIHLLPVFYFKI